jgi:hypothetical protein
VPHSAIVMRIALVITLLLLLVGCTSQHEAELQVNLTHATTQIAALDAQLNATAANLSTTESALSVCTQKFESAVADLGDTQRQLAFEKLQKDKFQVFYEQEVQQNAVLNQSLQSCLRKSTPQTIGSGYRTIPYDDLMRNSDLYLGSKVTYTGEVIQVSELNDGTFVLRVDVTNKGAYWSDTIWVEYTGPRVLENDLVTLTGTFDSLTTYQAVLGNDITIPKVTADGIVVTVKAADR